MKRFSLISILLLALLSVAPVSVYAADDMAMPETPGVFPATTPAGEALENAVTDHAVHTEDAHADAHGESKGGLPQFDPSTYASQLFWLAITFGVLFFVFSKRTLPQIGAVLQTREQHIQGNLDAAQAMKDKAEAARHSYEAALKQSQETAANFYATVESDIKRETAQKLEAFEARSASEVEKTEAEIEKARKDAMDSVQSIAAEIASLAAEKIVGISTDLDQAKTVVQKIKKAA